MGNQVGGIPADGPAFETAKSAQIIRSDIDYKKEMADVTEQFKGYQTMDPATHPVITKGKHAADIVSMKKYHEEYEDEKALIYYPVHISEGYEQVKKVKEATSDAVYKAGLEDNKKGNYFKPTDTETYAVMEEHESTKDRHYKWDYEATKHENKLPADNVATAHAQAAQPLQSNKLYQAEAKKDLQSANVPFESAGIQHPYSTQHLASHNAYNKDYEDNVKGAGRSDPANAFPEHMHHRANAANFSQSEYVKDATKDMNSVGGLPVDIPDIIRSKQAAEQLSDRNYKGEMSAVTEQFKGYQTMDPAGHPVVTKRQKDQALLSQKAYHEEYEDEKALIYYPVHISEGYEQVRKVKEATADKQYKANYAHDVQKNYFNAAETERYKGMKKLDGEIKSYTDEYERTKTDLKPAAETFEMVLSKKAAPLSKKSYAAEAKKDNETTHVDAGAVEIAHAKDTQSLQSKNVYNDKAVVGTGRSDNIEGFPEYKRAAEVAKHTSDIEYAKKAQKDAASIQGLPVDSVPFPAAKNASEIASDLHYKQNITGEYKGFQTMDPEGHPVIVKGKKAAEIISDIPYRQEYHDEKALIYFPQHITEGYESMNKAATFRTKYKDQYESEKEKNSFKMTDTERYADIQKQKKTLDRIYKEDYERTKHENKPVAESLEMSLAKSLKSTQSKKLYAAEAKKDLLNVHTDAGTVEIAHASESQKLSSKNTYKADYKKEIEGKGRVDAEGFPEYAHAKKIAANLQETSYSEKARQDMASIRGLPVDTPAMQTSKAAEAARSDIEYKKGLENLNQEYRGYQSLDAAVHPVITRGKKALEITSEIPYRQEYHDEKYLIYYPQHITEGYESNAKLKEAMGKYKADYEDHKAKNYYKYSDTELYANQQKGAQLLDRVYKADYEATKMINQPVADTVQMQTQKALHPFQSKKLYKEAAVEAMQSANHVGADGVEIAHARESQGLASMNTYKADYKQNIQGTGRKEAEAFPEHERLKKAGQLAGMKWYVEDAEKVMRNPTIPVDGPEFVRAKEAAAVYSDRNYKKDLPEVMEKMKGYQTLDAAVHPVITRGKKAKEITSDKLYREEWEDEKWMVYYPEHITPEYDSKQAVKKFQSKQLYKAADKEALEKNSFKFSDTEEYRVAQQLHDLVTDRLYKRAAAADMCHPKPPAVTFEMDLSNAAKPLAKQAYTADAKATMGKYNLDAGSAAIAHPMAMANLASDNLYKAAYNKDVKGQGPAVPAIAYPLTMHLSALANKMRPDEYKKEAAARMHEAPNLPYDTPEFNQAKENAINFNNRAYKQSGLDAIESMRGFQTINPADHPAVVKKNKDNEILSTKKYHEEYEDEKALIYYPYHITEGHEGQQKMAQMKRDYKKSYEEHKEKNCFKPTDTEGYKVGKALAQTVGDQFYDKAYKESRAHNLPPARTMEMDAADLVKNLSRQAYTAEAKKRM